MAILATVLEQPPCRDIKAIKICTCSVSVFHFQIVETYEMCYIDQEPIEIPFSLSVKEAWNERFEQSKIDQFGAPFSYITNEFKLK